MHKAANPNLAILETAVARLGPLADEVVFLGGCATGLLLTDPAAPPIRPTYDVDVISELTSIIEYHLFADRLRKRGFREDQEADAVICRWRAEGVVLDVMPTSTAVFDFGNDWYRPDLDTAESVGLPSGARIRVVTAPYFLATKLAAFDGRGNGDYMASHDMEDIVAVLDGRPELGDEIVESEDALKVHLAERFAALIDERDFTDSLAGHLPGDPGSQARLPILKRRIEAIARLA